MKNGKTQIAASAMVAKKQLLILLFLICSLSAHAKEVVPHASVKAKNGETALQLLQRVHLEHQHLPSFLLLNNIGASWKILQKDHNYQLPVLIRPFEGKSIRTSLGIPMTDAVHIRDYNALLATDGIKPAISDDRKIWQPYDNVVARATERQSSIGLLSAFCLDSSHIPAFNSLNNLEDGAQDTALQAGQIYRLPVHTKNYQGPTISEAIETSHFQAKKIHAFNKKIQAKSLKLPMWDDHLIWLPFHHRDNPLYGPVYSQFEVCSDQLKDCVFYLSPGHGGPDPGTMGVREGENICEDEYALDITLRLARELEANGARVEVLIKDEGIRDIKFLPGDSDETFANGQGIPSDQKMRLQQRVMLVNQMYRSASPPGHQRFLALHIDFRSNSQTHVDFDLYHHSSSKNGKRLASILQQTIEQQYSSRLGGRNFVGRIVSQPEEDTFFVIRETKMPAVLIELANINNALDQLRFIVIDSRQRIAEWLCEGLIKDWEEDNRVRENH